MTHRWVGVFAPVLAGCAGLVGIDDWAAEPFGDASVSSVASSASASSASSASSTASAGGGGGGGGAGEGGGGWGADGGAGAGTGASGGGGATASSATAGGGGAGCATLADGASCGAKESDRCCGGQCVDISTDVAHCGGCDTPCAAGKLCEPLEQTACGAAPADTSGRCTCTTNAQCPLNQVCDAGRCSPDSAANCDGVFVDVASCPNFCSY